MNFDKMIASIVEEVLRRLKKSPKKALIIFTGGTIGFNESIQQIRKLLEDGWNLKVLLSKSAEFVLTSKLIKEQLKIEDIYLESEVTDIKALYTGIDLLIIPVLTINTAAKIALGISDTLATYIVSCGIMKGIPIVAAKDACDLKNSTRLSLGYDKTPAVYLNKINSYLNTLEEYGIKLVDSNELYDAVVHNTNQFEFQSNILNKRVITTEDIIKAKQKNEEIIVPEDAIVTLLAYDVAEEMGVKIVRMI